MISQELFEEVYLSGDFEDAHSELAQRMGITRSEAKQITHLQRYAYVYGYGACGDKINNPYVALYGSGHADFCVGESEGLILPKKEVTNVGNKGDRVYQAPKAFWNKSK